MIMNICPSKDLNSDQYYVYLKYASVEELETDTIKKSTYLGCMELASPTLSESNEPAYDYEEDLKSGFLYTTDNL